MDALADIARATRVDDGLVSGVDPGPVNNAPQFERIRSLVSDAADRGGRVVVGGPRRRATRLYRPTIVDGVDDQTPLVAEEQFGPALPVVSFATEAEAVERANLSPYGLTGSVWSSVVEHAYEGPGLRHRPGLREQPRCRLQAHLPVGGEGQWDRGGERSVGLDAYLELQVIKGLSHPSDAH